MEQKNLSDLIMERKDKRQKETQLKKHQAELKEQDLKVRLTVAWKDFLKFLLDEVSVTQACVQVLPFSEEEVARFGSPLNKPVARVTTTRGVYTAFVNGADLDHIFFNLLPRHGRVQHLSAQSLDDMRSELANRIIDEVF